MYRIYADNVLIYSDAAPNKDRMAVNPELTMAAGSAGSLCITLPKGCAGYDSLRLMGTTITFERDLMPIWSGRALTEKRDMWGSRVLFCEGALAFLNDTVYLNWHPEPGIGVGTAFEEVLNLHNNLPPIREMEQNRWIYPGTCQMSGFYVSERGEKSSLDAIQDMVSQFGGMLRMRYLNVAGSGETPVYRPYLDWLKDFPAAQTGAQTLEFDRNLLDFTRNWDMSNFVTYVYVEGAPGGTSGSLHYNSGWVYIADEPTPASLYGRIEKKIVREELTSDLACQQAAIDYLTYQQFGAMTLDVTALDLHMLDRRIRPFDLYDRVQVISRLHGLNAEFAVTGIKIRPEEPEKTAFTLEPVGIEYSPWLGSLTQVVYKNSR